MTTSQRAAHAPARLDLADRLPEFYASLTQQRQFRLEQLQELAEEAARSSPETHDVHAEVAEILRTSATTALTEVEAALDRLHGGRFGMCERCAKHISHERLEILPMSRYCTPCQHAREMRSV